MIKHMCGVAGLMLWGAAVFAAADRPGAVAEMQTGVAELGTLLEAQGVVFQPETLSANVLAAAVRAIDAGASIVSPEQAKRFQEAEKGVFYSVGLKLTLKDKRPNISEIATNSPAQAAGIHAGTILEKIDDQSTENMTLRQVVNRLQGGKNEPVTLTIRAEDKGAEAQTFKLTRSVLFETPATETPELWPQQIGYLKINGLYEGAGDPIVAQLKAWSSSTNCVGMILDLRGANGISLDAAGEIAGLFAHASPTLFTVKDGFNKPLKTYSAGKNDKPLDRPVTILVDGDTRGAAETLAAVLQDCQGVILVGTTSRGDDRLREPLAIANGKVLYIAVRRIDLGKTGYNGQGVKPDVVVTPAGEQAKAKDNMIEEDIDLFSGLSEQEKQDRTLNTHIGNDLVLRRATDILLGLKALNLYTH